MYFYIGFHLMLTMASVSLHELGTSGGQQDGSGAKQTRYWLHIYLKDVKSHIQEDLNRMYINYTFIIDIMLSTSTKWFLNAYK